MAEHRIETPLSDEVIAKLHAGDKVFLSGYVLTGRDAAHKKLIDLIKEGKDLPIDIKGQLIYYVGPTPARPGKPIGSATGWTPTPRRFTRWASRDRSARASGPKRSRRP